MTLFPPNCTHPIVPIIQYIPRAPTQKRSPQISPRFLSLPLPAMRHCVPRKKRLAMTIIIPFPNTNTRPPSHALPHAFTARYSVH